MDALETLPMGAGESPHRVLWRGWRQHGVQDSRLSQWDGLYHQKFEYPPETIISHSFLPCQSSLLFSVLPGEDAALGLSPMSRTKKLAQWEQEEAPGCSHPEH